MLPNRVPEQSISPFSGDLMAALASPDLDNECPLCKRPLALSSRVGTMGEEPRQRLFSRRALIMGIVLLLVGVPAAAIGIIFLFPTLFLAAAGEADSTGAIRVGMTVRDVCKTLDIEAPPRAFSGTITWGRDSRILRIRFKDGMVAALEEGSLPFPVTVNKIQPETRRPR